MFAVLWRKRHRAVVMNQAHGLVGHGDAPVLSEGCEPLISGQDVPLRYRVGCVASRSKLPRERFSPLTQPGHWSWPDSGPRCCYDGHLAFPSRGCVLSSEHVERRLTAILAADVAGSCRLIGIDEEGTLARLKALRRTLFDPKIAEHHGRVVKNSGDGAIAEFASVVDAVRCADEIQRSTAEQNIDVPRDKRIELRIGIHVGDIIIEENDIFGDGVNIAVRLEGIAEPGGISISDDTRRQIRGKIESTLEDMGSQSLKNIAEPMRAWRVRIGPSSSQATKPPTET